VNFTKKTVSFTEMKNGTQEDYHIIEANDLMTAQELPNRLIEQLKEMAADNGAYKISRLDHVLQCATRAYRDGADDDWIIAALLHDIGDILAPFTHGQLASEIMRPFVRPEITWVVRYHGAFQMFYNTSLTEDERNSRDQYKTHPYYQYAVDFCEKWDQCSFDPEYEWEILDFFVPIVNKVFSKKPFSE